MAEKNNATCSICGKDYHLCLSCKDTISMSPWKIHTDTAEHYKVFQVIRGYSTGVYTKDEFKDRLKNVDLSDLNSFRPHIKKIIEDVLNEPVAKAVETEVAMVEENLVVEDVKNIEKTTTSRKRNYKVEIE